MLLNRVPEQWYESRGRVRASRRVSSSSLHAARTRLASTPACHLHPSTLSTTMASADGGAYRCVLCCGRSRRSRAQPTTQFLPYHLLSERQARPDRACPGSGICGNDEFGNQGYVYVSPRAYSDLMARSYKWHRDRHREEVPLHPHRRLYVGEGCRDLSEYRSCILRDGPRLSHTRRQGTEECTGLLEDIR